MIDLVCPWCGMLSLSQNVLYCGREGGWHPGCITEYTNSKPIAWWRGRYSLRQAALRAALPSSL